MADRWWINGELSRSIDVADRGLAYGDGLFETIAVRGGRPRFLDLHLARLEDGCRRIGIPPPDGNALENRLRMVAGEASHAVLKVILTRGTGPRGYAPPVAPRPTLAYGLLDAEPGRDGGAGIRTRLCRVPASRSAITAGLKSLARLDQVLARAEWSDPSIEEGLMRDEAGNLVGGTSSNVFLVLDGNLFTPLLTRAGVHGIMRRVVMEQSTKLGIAVREVDCSIADIERASELFVTNALTGIRPVQAVDGRSYSTGSITLRLRAQLASLGVEECAEPF